MSTIALHNGASAPRGHEGDTGVESESTKRSVGDRRRAKRGVPDVCELEPDGGLVAGGRWLEERLLTSSDFLAGDVGGAQVAEVVHPVV